MIHLTNKSGEEQDEAKGRSVVLSKLWNDTGLQRQMTMERAMMLRIKLAANAMH
jgi:hypothetical protein